MKQPNGLEIQKISSDKETTDFDPIIKEPKVESYREAMQVVYNLHIFAMSRDDTYLM